MIKGKRMNIIICDDEKSTCGELERMLMEYARKNGICFNIEVFFTGDSLADYLDKEVVDVLFLDIEIPGLDGIMIGDYIRRKLENESIFIVYISSKEQYALQLFQNRPFDFLIKPLEKTRIFNVMDNICRIAGKTSRDFEYQNKGTTFRIPCREILYFQSYGRKINIVMRNESRSFYGKLTDVEKNVPSGLFLNIHKSYLINFNYVVEYTYEWVKIINGDILNISKVNRSEIRRKILEIECDGHGEFK